MKKINNIGTNSQRYITIFSFVANDGEEWAVCLSLASRSSLVLDKYTWVEKHLSDAPGVDLIKLFWHKFTLFCKLDHFIAMK